MKQIEIPKITSKEKQVPKLLYKFRFLNSNHIQKALKHKNHHRINEWLNDLVSKGLIEKIDDEKNVTKPAVYCLSQKAKNILKDDKNINKNFLKWLYKEKDRDRKFIAHHLSLADIYIFFLSKQKKNTILNFFNKHELRTYKFFPEDLPDVYISTKTNGTSNRYFLNLFEEYTPKWALRKIIKDYISYFEEGTWQSNTKEKFPKILIVSPDENTKKHLSFFTRSKINIFEEDLSFYLTTKDKLQNANNENIWQKLE